MKERWEVIFTEDAVKDIKRLVKGLGKERTEKVLKKLVALLENLDDYISRVKPVRGLEGVYRVRIGTLRVAFVLEREERKVKVIAIGFRESFYEKLMR